jgi:putative DNA primase/helicase
MNSDDVVPPAFPTSKEELKQRLKGEIFHTFLPEEDKPLEPFRNYTEYFDKTSSGGLRFIPLWLANDIMRNRQFVTMKDNKEVYVYDKEQGIYKPGGEALIRTLTAVNLGKMHRKHYAAEVLYHIQVSTYKDRDELSLPEDLLVLQNGLFHIPTRKLFSYDPRIFALNRLPVKYDPDADCPRIKKFFSEVVTEEDMKVLQEAYGYCLKHGYPYQKAFIFVGDGANGKSTTFRLLINFLGAENVSSVSLQDLVYHRFMPAELYGKMVNVYDDLPNITLKHTGKFKMATGDGFLTVERKHRDPFQFFNEAKMFFSCNQLPKIDDNTIAFFRRIIIINFPNKFMGDHADPDLLADLTTEEELSGLLNWALEGLERLEKRGAFSYSSTVDEVQRQYERMSNPIKAFRLDHLLIQSESWIEKDELYGLYIEYCINNGLPAKTKGVFSQLLHKEMGKALENYRPRINGRRVPCWKGIKYVENKVVSCPDQADQGTQGGQGGQPSEPLSRPGKSRCAFCGIPLNAETGKFMDPRTMRYYCRSHFKNRASELYDEEEG